MKTAWRCFKHPDAVPEVHLRNVARCSVPGCSEFGQAFDIKFWEGRRET